MRAAHGVRRAERQEVRAIGRMLARAFHDDPFAEWIWPPGTGSPATLARFYGWRVRSLIAQREVWIAGDMAAAGAWALPGRWQPGLLHTLAALPLLATAGRRLAVLKEGLELLDRVHPRAPHMYLAVLGTDPPRQGTGAGSAALEPVLAQCDAAALPAYLESSKERNIGFYERHGFEVSDEVRLPEGPRAWPMWRVPRRL